MRELIRNRSKSDDVDDEREEVEPAKETGSAGILRQEYTQEAAANKGDNSDMLIE